MSKVVLLLAFYKANGDWVDKLNRVLTKSKYSHVEVVVGNTWISSGPRDKDVRVMDVKEVNLDYWDFVEYRGVVAYKVY